MDAKTARIRALNDELRHKLTGGHRGDDAGRCGARP